MTDHSFILPILPMAETNIFIIECHKKFMCNFTKINTGGLAFRAYFSICQTAQQTTTTPEHIARVLVDIGLQANKTAFPINFVQHIEHHNCNHGLEKHQLNSSQRALFTFWKNPPVKFQLYGSPFTASTKEPSMRVKASLPLRN